MARWQRSWTDSWGCFPRARRLNVHSGIWAKPWNHQLVHVLPSSITMTCHQHPSLSMSISCTFKHMNANIRPLKHKVHTQQPCLVAYVFKTLQPQYLSRTINTLNYYVNHMLRCKCTTFRTSVGRNIFFRKRWHVLYQVHGIANALMLLMYANSRWKALPVTRLLFIFNERTSRNLHGWH